MGVEFRRNARGSHEVWWDPSTSRYTIIPNHPRREIARGTLARILKDLGLTEEALNRGR